MNSKYIPLPDFDYLAELAKNEPDTFDLLKESIIQSLIDQAKPETRQHLETLQFRIEQEVARSSNPYDAMIRVSRMMHDKMDYLRGALTMLGKGSDEAALVSFVQTGQDRIRRVNFGQRRTCEVID